MKKLVDKIFSIVKKHRVFTFFLCIALFLWLFILFFDQNKYVDEGIHLNQIRKFLNGKYEMVPIITMLPGYHATMALIAKPFGISSLTTIRFISFLPALASIWVFFAISQNLGTQNPFTKTLQFIFLPISFLYFPLVYTDIFALFLVLFAFYSMIKKRYKLSALFSFASILARQTNIVWTLFIWVYGYLSIYGFTVSQKKLLSYAKSTIGHILTFGAFAIFLFLNKGISVGDEGVHQIGFYMGNIYFFLAMVGFLLLPILPDSFRKFDSLQSKRFLIFGAGIGVFLVCLFLIFPPAIHFHNLKTNFLRNIILQYAYNQYAWLYGSAIFLGCVTLCIMKFEKIALLLFPFAFFCLLPSLLVEQRYSIVPFVFLLLFRKEINQKTESALVLYFLLLSLGLVYMISKTKIFF